MIPTDLKQVGKSGAQACNGILHSVFKKKTTVICKYMDKSQKRKEVKNVGDL